MLYLLGLCTHTSNSLFSFLKEKWYFLHRTYRRLDLFTTKHTYNKNFSHEYVKMSSHLHLLCKISHLLFLPVNPFPLRFSPPLIPSPLLLLFSHLSSSAPSLSIRCCINLSQSLHFSLILEPVQNKQRATCEPPVLVSSGQPVCHQLWPISSWFRPRMGRGSCCFPSSSTVVLLN